MIADKIAIPRFATEAEEAEWLDAHQDEHSEVAAKAMQEGRTTSAPKFWAKHGLSPEKIRVYLNSEDVDAARRQADAKGVDTESYLQDLVHEAVNAAR